MKARADAVSGARGGRHVRRPHAARARARTTSTASSSSSPASRGRRRAGEDEGRARRRARPAAPQIARGDAAGRPSEAARHDRAHLRRGSVPARRRPDATRSTSSTTRSSRPSRAATRPASPQLFAAMLDFVRANGTRIADDELVGLRRDPAAAGPLLRRGRQRVHGRGPDPGLAASRGSRRPASRGRPRRLRSGSPRAGTSARARARSAARAPICALSCSSRSVVALLVAGRRHERVPVAALVVVDEVDAALPARPRRRTRRTAPARRSRRPRSRSMTALIADDEVLDVGASLRGSSSGSRSSSSFGLDVRAGVAAGRRARPPPCPSAIDSKSLVASGWKTIAGRAARASMLDARSRA